jgi:ParB family chromosome partitioning protein
MVKVKGLGRGLDALLAADEEFTPSEENQKKLSVTLLQSGKYQPRTKMDTNALSELAESIKAQGIIQPILVRPVANNRYEIIAGERRWRAAKMAGFSDVPVIIRDIPDEAALAMALIENIQREDLNPLEEAHGIQRLIDEFGMTHQTAAESVGRSRSAVTNLLRLTQLAPPVQDLLMEGKIDMGHARALLSLSTAKQIELARLAAEKQFSVREIEKQVQQLERTTTPKAKAALDRDSLRLQEELSEKIGARVKIEPDKKGGTGKLIIQYNSLAHLDQLLTKFK